MDVNINRDRDRKARRKTAPDVSTMLYGKVPPQARELEEAVLGAVMLEKGAFDTIIEILKAECFYVDAHQRVFRAFISLANNSQPIDILTVVEELKRREELDMVGGAYFVTRLTNSVVSTANLEAHARIILQKFIQRELIRISGETIGDAYEDSTDVFDLLDQAESRLFEITNNHLRKNYTDIQTELMKALQRIDDLRHSTEEISGVPSGFGGLDRVTYGWQQTDLIILAARPAVGKTAFALNLARNAATHPSKSTPVAFFSLEMSSSQLVQRILSAESEIWLEKISRGKLEEHEMQQLLVKGINRLDKAPIFIDDTAALNIFELRAKCRRLKNKHNIGLIIIDYLQLMTAQTESKGGNREQEISTISRNLKGLAKELQVPIIALSQLSREVEKRKDGEKMPQLSDLRECVTGDTLVWQATGERVPVKEMVGKQASVWCVNDALKITRSETEIIWPVGEKPVYELRLQSGRVLKATAEHKMLAYGGWKTVGEITARERLAIARQIPEPEHVVQIEPEKLELLAHLIGDGSYLTRQPLRYTTASEDNSRAVKNAAEKIFGCTVKRHAGRGKWHQLVISGNGNRWQPQGVNKWLRELGIYNQRSHEKTIPGFVFQLASGQIALFLRHLWATDGTLYAGKNMAVRIAFSTNSVQLAEAVAALLLRLGIVARIRKVVQKAYRPMYSVDVSGKEHQELFLNVVGAYGAKQEQANAVSTVLAYKKSNTNVDTLPEEVFASVKQSMGRKKISHRTMARLRGTAYGGSAHFEFSPSRQVVAGYAALLEDEQLESMATNDVFWDTVVSVEPCGTEPVYDLTVTGTHNWIANCGMITHNSGAIEQDADMVMFLYRPEYYNITTTEMGEDNRGETHVRIAKHRNGSLETIKLRAKLHIQKFVEDEGLDGDFGGGSGGFGGGGSTPPGGGGSWKPVTDIDDSGGARMFIERGSKMNDLDDEPPF